MIFFINLGYLSHIFVDLLPITNYIDSVLRPKSSRLKETKYMDDIKHLERTIDNMLAFLDKTKAENLALRNKLEELSQEKASLMQKNDQAKNRLESMITRLKSLEQTA